MNKRYKNKNYTKTAYLLVLVIVFLSIGYSAFGTDMNISNIVAKIRLKKDIRISGAVSTEVLDSTVNYTEYNISGVQSSVDLTKSTSTATYKISVINLGNVEVGLLKIDNLPSNLDYELTDYTLKDKICDDTNKCSLGISKEFYLTIKYKDINVTYGDINSDGSINTKDGVILAMYLTDNSTEINKFAADVNLDGEIDELDAEILSQYLAGWSVSLPSVTIEDINYGDINSDGSINNIDLELLEGYLNGASLTDEQLKLANVFIDNKIDELDVVVLTKYIQGETGYTSLPMSNNVNGYIEDNTLYNLDLFFDFQPIYNVTYIDIDGGYQKEVISSDTLRVNFGTNAPSNIEVTMDGEIISNYTYTDGVLTIPNVSGNIIITDAGPSYVCRKATLLHEETCSQTTSSQNCRGAGYSSGGTIIYGNETTTEELVSGDAFDCDVNGDGIYDSETERFYYVSGIDGNTDSEYGVLVYYNNTTLGVADNTSSSLIAYDSTANGNHNGPVTAITNLPTINQWTNTSLSSIIRAITTENGSTSTNGGTLPTDFSYTDSESVAYSARLLTYQEIETACGSTINSSGGLDSCNYLLENTTYSSSTMGTYGYWLETPNSSSSSSAWYVTSTSRVVKSHSIGATSYAGVRPAIEILKASIAYTSDSMYSVSYENIEGNYQTKVVKNETLVVDFGANAPSSIEVTMNGEVITDYTYTNGVLTISGVTGDIVIKGPSYLCKRATIMHEEICERTTGYCGDWYSTDDYITYGKEFEELVSGNAYDCDVNGDDIYDPETERFYYVSDLYNTTTGEFDSEYAVLVYYNNTTAGIPDNTSAGNIAYYKVGTSFDGYRGPVTAISNLPTVNQWTNVSLSSVTRAIVTSQGTTSISGNALPTAFSYTTKEGIPYAARLLTYQEVETACGTDNVLSGILDSCNYLMENTQYSNDAKASGYWLESPGKSGGAYIVNGDGNNIKLYRADSSFAVRPAIEVLKTNIDY